jgi:DegV family protein with EDD domain
MQIVTDSGTDVHLTPEQLKEMSIHIIPLSVTLEGKTYQEGVDIRNEDFYPLLEASDELPTTSQPPAGAFAELYRQLAKTDPEILSIHISSGLSGTVNAAKAGAAMVPEAHVTVVDTKTLSVPAGWQVEAAGRAVKGNWPLERILDTLKQIDLSTEVVYTLKELKYLIHGGRISHMKGLIASLLNIKPLIGVEKVDGRYEQLGQARSFERAIENISAYISKKYAEGTELRVQVVHSNNPDGAQRLIDTVARHFKCDWLPTSKLSLVLGAHVGSSMIGIAFAPAKLFNSLP